MRLIFKSFVSLSILLQWSVIDSQAQKFIPHTFMAGVDVPGIIRSLASTDVNMGELQLNLNVASHRLIFEYGFENIDRSDDNFDYNTKGPFFRAGADFTLNPKNPDGHQIFTGIRYARANYKNRVSFQADSQAFSDPEVSVNNEELIGSWLEWTFGMRVMLNRFLAIGYTMRYKFGRDITGSEVLSSFDLPGYGRAQKKSNFGISYYLYYKLKFREPKEPIIEVVGQ